MSYYRSLYHYLLSRGLVLNNMHASNSLIFLVFARMRSNSDGPFASLAESSIILIFTGEGLRFETKGTN